MHCDSCFIDRSHRSCKRIGQYLAIHCEQSAVFKYKGLDLQPSGRLDREGHDHIGQHEVEGVGGIRGEGDGEGAEQGHHIVLNRARHQVVEVLGPCDLAKCLILLVLNNTIIWKSNHNS